MYVLVFVLDLYPKPKYIFSCCQSLLMNSFLMLTFLPNPVPGDKKLPCLSNPIPYPEYLYFSMSASLVRLTARNKQLSTVG